MAYTNSGMAVLVLFFTEAWHANEVLQEGPLIKDLGRCGHIPENNRGNDTKVPRQKKKWNMEKLQSL